MSISKKNTKSDSRPKVGVVVSSGGLKSISSIPLFEFLEEAGIEVDLLIGCSAGSIFTGWWATCNDASSMRDEVARFWTRDLFAKTDYRTLLSIAGLPFGRFDKTRGLLKADAIHDSYKMLYGDQRMEDLKIRTIFQATDLLSGDPVLLSSGLLRETVYASGALFPMLPSFCINDRWLIDGVYSSPLPIMKAVMEGMDVIIAMTNEEVTEEESKGFVHYFMRCNQYSSNWLQRNQTALSVDMHHHEIVFVNAVFDRFIGLRATRRIPEILKAGEVAVEEKKVEIINAIDNFKGSR
jgi:NTE family protein